MSDSSDSSSSDSRDERLHNDGQADGAKPWGSYDPPHSALSTFAYDTEKKMEDNAKYDEGFHHAREQHPR